MPMTPREMIKLLKQNGFKEVSQNGSHIKMINENTNKQTIVPYHGKALKKGWNKRFLNKRGLNNPCRIWRYVYEQIILPGIIS